MPKRNSGGFSDIPEPVRFVRAKQEDESGENFKASSSRKSRTGDLDGSEIRAFYEDLVGINEPGPSVSSSASSSPPKKQRSARKTKKHSETTCNKLDLDFIESSSSVPYMEAEKDKFNIRDYTAFLKASEVEDTETVKRYLSEGIHLDFQDSHGWSALMCASCAGKFKAVQLLIKLNANSLLCDKKGRTARDLAKKGKHYKIVDILDGTYVETCEKVKQVTHPTFFCDVCQCDVTNSTVASHESSTSHLFKMNISPKPATYMIPASNRGFQMMLRGGWDQERGLGPEGGGTKFPVKTVLKRDRYGLGVPSDSRSKVTHFNPHDLQAVKRDKVAERALKHSTLTKLERSKKETRDKVKERRFREQFYVDL